MILCCKHTAIPRSHSAHGVLCKLVHGLCANRTRVNGYNSYLHSGQTSSILCCCCSRQAVWHEACCHNPVDRPLAAVGKLGMLSAYCQSCSRCCRGSLCAVVIGCEVRSCAAVGSVAVCCCFWLILCAVATCSREVPNIVFAHHAADACCIYLKDTRTQAHKAQ